MYKESVVHVQSYCFTYLNLIAFLPFSLNSLSSLRKLPIVAVRACLHGVGDPGLVGLVSFVFTL